MPLPICVIARLPLHSMSCCSRYRLRCLCCYYNSACRRANGLNVMRKALTLSLARKALRSSLSFPAYFMSINPQAISPIPALNCSAVIQRLRALCHWLWVTISKGFASLEQMPVSPNYTKLSLPMGVCSKVRWKRLSVPMLLRKRAQA